MGKHERADGIDRILRATHQSPAPDTERTKLNLVVAEVLRLSQFDFVRRNWRWSNTLALDQDRIGEGSGHMGCHRVFVAK